jgi:hypothetical protein
MSNQHGEVETRLAYDSKAGSVAHPPCLTEYGYIAKTTAGTIGSHTDEAPNQTFTVKAEPEFSTISACFLT